MTAVEVETGRASRAGRAGRRVVAVVAAVAAALAVWAVLGALAGVDLVVRADPRSVATLQVGPVAVFATSLVAALAGWAFLAVLERRISRARSVWTAVALVVLALSLAGPLTAGATVAAKLALAAVHLVVAAVLVPLLRRTAVRSGTGGGNR